MKRVSILLTGVLFLCASFIPAPALLAQHQYPQGYFTLVDGKVQIPGEEGWYDSVERDIYSKAVIEVRAGRATIEADTTYDIMVDDQRMTGTVKIEGLGGYDEKTGVISGDFTLTSDWFNDHSATPPVYRLLSDEGSSLFEGTFSSPAILSDRVVVTFSGTLSDQMLHTFKDGTTDELGGSRPWSRKVDYKVGGPPGGEAEPDEPGEEPAQEEPDSKDSGVRFGSLKGDVEVRPEVDKRGWRKARLDTPLPKGTVIRTSANSSLTLVLPDSTTFVLGPKSILLIGDPDDDNRHTLQQGKMKVFIKKLIQDATLEIEMDQSISLISGTTLVAEQDDTTSTLKVLEGTVEVTSKATGESVTVTAGQAVSADANGLGDLEGFDAAAEKAEWEALEADLSSGDDSGGLSSWVYAVIAAGAVLVLGAAALLLLKRSRNRKGAAPA